MRLVPKASVAAYVHSEGILPALVLAAASGEPWAPVAQRVIDVMFDPEASSFDLDHPDWIAGAEALVAAEVVTQSDLDAIAAMVPPPEPWVYFGAAADGPGRWLLVFTRDGIQRSVMAKTDDPAAHADHIIASGIFD